MAGAVKQDVASSEPLASGQFYGEVVRRHRASEIVLSELRHAQRRVFPSHSHRLAYFCLLLSGGMRSRSPAASSLSSP